MNFPKPGRWRKIAQPSDVTMALGLLTRLPLPPIRFTASDTRPAARAAWAYPLAGAVVALVMLVLGGIAMALGADAGLTAALMLLTGAVVTGAMHADGLADCADGFWGGHTLARRLEIMKDSQIGTYGVLALILSVLLHWHLLSGLGARGLPVWPVLTAEILSRAGMVAVMAALPQARHNGLSVLTGRPGGAAVAIAIGLALVTALLAPGVSALAVVLAAGAASLSVALIARAKIGGQTGDVLGATQQVAGLAVLAVFQIAASG